MYTRHFRAAAVASSLALAVLAPSVASAAHVRSAPFFAPHRITIHAQPNPIVVGDSVVIFGRLFGRNAENRLVVLYHRPLDSPFGFVPVQTTRTGPGASTSSRAPTAASTRTGSGMWRQPAPIAGSSRSALSPR